MLPKTDIEILGCADSTATLRYLTRVLRYTDTVILQYLDTQIRISVT